MLFTGTSVIAAFGLAVVGVATVYKAIRDFVATMQVSRDFKEIRRKRLPIFISGADHAFQDPMGRWIATGTLAE